MMNPLPPAARRTASRASRPAAFRPLRTALALALALTAAGCAKAVNYSSPSGPLQTHLSPPDTTSTTTQRPLRVVSFNIAFAIEIERAIEVLRQTESLRGADIIALQEMDWPGTQRIARALGMNAVYSPSGVHPKHRRDFGCAILSPWPLEEPRKLILPHPARISGLQRVATSAIVIRGGERIRAYSVHLPAPISISGQSRLEELRALAADTDSSDVPVVIAGDFNTHGKVGELERAGYDWVTRDIGGTCPFKVLGIPLARLRYDHILARGLRGMSAPDAVGVVEDNRGASDHHPIWAVLTLPETAQSR